MVSGTAAACFPPPPHLCPLSFFPAPLFSTHPEPCSPWAASPRCVVLVCFGVCTHRGREGWSRGPPELLVTLCWCSLSQPSAWSRARTAGAAPSPGDAPAPRAGRGQPARQVPAMSPLCCSLCHTCPAAAGTASPGSIPAAMGLWVSFALHQPFRGVRDQRCGSYQTLGHV